MDSVLWWEDKELLPNCLHCFYKKQGDYLRHGSWAKAKTLPPPGQLSPFSPLNVVILNVQNFSPLFFGLL